MKDCNKFYIGSIDKPEGRLYTVGIDGPSVCDDATHEDCIQVHGECKTMTIRRALAIIDFLNGAG